jgi:hypothetical protein
MKKVKNGTQRVQKVEVTIEKTFVIEWFDDSTKNEARKKTYDFLWALLSDEYRRTGKDPIKKFINKSKTKVTERIRILK